MNITTLEREKIIKTFFDNNKLINIPAKKKKKLVVLEKILESFDLKKEYTEKEVNSIIENFFEDYCAIRRAFIDYSYMKRENGIYSLLEHSK